MIDFDRDFEEECSKYLSYLYVTAENKYRDCDDIDVIVQESMLVYLMKIKRGEIIEHPKAFLSSVLYKKRNDLLREKYRNKIVSYDALESIAGEDDNSYIESQSDEYIAVRREIGRLINIYREVTVRYYVYNESVEQIADELCISKGTVMSRLSSARNQIKEGIKRMEKYSRISYEPKEVSLGIWGSSGFGNEPFSLIHSQIESNILILAYEKPISISELADTIGMPCAYIEPIVEMLVDGELVGKTKGGLVYTRCFMQKYEDSFGDILAQETLADKYAEKIWEIVWGNIEPLTKREVFIQMSEKQKATMVLFIIKQIISECILSSRPKEDCDIVELPERPNGGKWLATGTIFNHGQNRDGKYDSSGPVNVNYRVGDDGKNICQLFDFQSVFGDTHWAYVKFKYKFSLQSILRFYASFLPCNVKPDNVLIYDMIPEFEKLHIFSRDEDGRAVLDIPAMPFDEVKLWNPVYTAIEKECKALLSDELKELWLSHINHVPKHVDNAEHYRHTGALGAYTVAQLISIVNKKLMPYPVEIGKTPIIYIAYQNKE